MFDSLTLDFALDGIGALRLGQRAGTDFVSISLSTTDAVGHRWGPGSREMHDHVLNVDRWLGQFLDSLGKLVPLGSVVITLTSDHGVTEFPEAGAGGRLDLSPQVRALNAWARLHGDSSLRAGSEEGLVFGEFDVAAARYHLNVDSLASAAAARIAALPGVRRVYTPATLARASSSDLDAMRWRRQLPPGFSWLVAVSVQPHWVFGGGTGSTGHGTTNPDDVQVPIIFRIPGTAAARVERVVRTIDIAPTLAAVLGIRPTQPSKAASRGASSRTQEVIQMRVAAAVSGFLGTAPVRRVDPPRMERRRPAQAGRREHSQGAPGGGGRARPSRQSMTAPKVSTASAIPNH